MFLSRRKRKITLNFLTFARITRQTNLSEKREKFVRISVDILDYKRLSSGHTAASPIKAETVQREEKTDTESAPSTARMLRRGSSRGVSVAFRIGWTASRPVGRSVGVADSNGRRSVSRLLRGSYVNMETGSWNPVLDSTYDSNQRG